MKRWLTMAMSIGDIGLSSRMSQATLSNPPAVSARSRQRHPIGLYTLFFTEMWERLSYYGMRALLVLFMVDTARGGMGLSDKTAASIYGLYTSAVYLAALPGGWIADRFLGAQRAVWYGGIIIAVGHFVLAIPRAETFYAGLILVVIGTGMLKPNVSAMVGELYPEGGARRDAGFSVFYMGINLGAFIGPFICGTLGERLNWHYGFGAAGLGMVFGLIQYRGLKRNLGAAGLRPGNAGQTSNGQKILAFGAIVALMLLVALGIARIIRFDPIAMAQATTAVLVGIAIVFFGGIFLFGRLDKIERQRVAVIVILCAVAILFFAGLEQAGSSLNLFADRYTQRKIGFEIPTTWFQALSPIFVITLAPVMGAL